MRRRLTAALLLLPVLLQSPARAQTARPDAEQLQRSAEAAASALLDREGEQSAALGAAGAALEQYAAAVRAAEDAAAVADQQRAVLAGAAERTATARSELGRWAAQLYRSGASDPRLALVTDLLDTRDPQQLLDGLRTVQRVTGSQDDALTRFAGAEAEQAAAATAAEQAALLAQAASSAAAQGKRLADALVAESARRLAEARSAVEQAESARAAAAATAACADADLAGYANGRLPESALCALADAPGHLLRADAAEAFARMSAAYEAATGSPLCVTDSYRSYAAQVAVAAAKPTLAAVPGTSNHGWGIALDLCGGVQDFGTPAHVWLQTNSIAFGWFHPQWAQADGSKPEPWHWEFAG